MTEKINLWLDDVRPAPAGWFHVKTVDQAKPWLEGGVVLRASLDHDLGACGECFAAAGVAYTGDVDRDWAAWVVAHEGQVAPNCPHVGTGYELVAWMEATGHWPDVKPTVHSANPVGAARMRQAINRSFRCKQFEKFAITDPRYYVDICARCGDVHDRAK